MTLLTPDKFAVFKWLEPLENQKQFSVHIQIVYCIRDQVFGWSLYYLALAIVIAINFKKYLRIL